MPPATLKINITSDSADGRRGIDATGQSLGRLGSAAKAAGAALAAGLAVGVGAAATLATKSVKAASDLNETLSKTQVLFGASAGQVQAFADTAAGSLGQSKQSALDAAATFAQFGKSAGLSGKNLVGFSTQLTGLASDMASFSNTSPQQAIDALGAALRGESEPIRQYNVLLDDATLRQRALKLGITSTTTQALTPQQRVLAAHAEILAQTTAQQGDFARTSAGLANQQRILGAQWANFKTTLGQALLPAVLSIVAALNTQFMPALTALAQQHGPAIKQFADSAAAGLATFAARLSQVDWSAIGTQIGQVFGDVRDKLAGIDWAAVGAAIADLGPKLKDVATQTDVLRPTAEVLGVVFRVLAEHTDELGKALPFLAAAFVAVKVAQLAANVAAVISPVLKLADVAATRSLAAANRELTASLVAQGIASRANTVAQVADTAATNAGILARARAVVGMVASRVAMVATTVATGAWTAAQWLLNVALTANPIGIVVVAITLLVAGLILAWKRSETFRDVVTGAFRAVSTVVRAVVGFIIDYWQGLWRTLSGIVATIKTVVSGAWNTITSTARTAFGILTGILTAPFRAAEDAVDKVIGKIRELIDWIRDRIPKLPGFLDRLNPFDAPRVGVLAAAGPALRVTAAAGPAAPRRLPALAALLAPTVRVYIGQTELTDLVRVVVGAEQTTLTRRLQARRLR